MRHVHQSVAGPKCELTANNLVDMSNQIIGLKWNWFKYKTIIFLWLVIQTYHYGLKLTSGFWFKPI